MNAALVIIDVQKAMFTMAPPVHNGKNLLQNISRLIEFANKKGLKIIFVQHNGPENSPLEKNTPGWHIHENISPRPKDIVIEKTTPDSFYDTALQSQLREHNIHKLYLTGIQTEACVDTTCRRGFSERYKITLVKDTHSTFDKPYISSQHIIDHHNEVLRWFAEIKTVDEILR
ncbi:isochorismatase family protein [Pontibacillus yanchengensis]|uniref:Isochorismatase family protein n=2 Tax=Pontibacillus yanchengensis TaxID=462910 RepID=A0ACC7VEX1_9BACI|nr:cysteine hydrolase family protein [Pontibacillus yanchengensis]MYL32095.1 isochorismatase family protein [Pontibacillus yanchengensis]MYL52675.1 isochorismatase family protein [Pontibacillus yanchengensis]